MNTNVLVINPYITDFKLYDEWMHPVGLYFLIDTLEKNNIHTCYFDFLSPARHTQEKKFGTGMFYNCELSKPSVYTSIKRKYKLYGVPPADFTSFLGQIPRPDLICIGSSMTYWAPGIIETVSLIRKYLPETPIVIGGIASRLMPAFFETHLPDCFNAGSLQAATDVSAGIPILSSLTIDMQHQSLHGGIRRLSSAPHGPLLLSVGCPMRCSYCASSILQPYYLPRKTELVISELEQFVTEHKTSDFAFYDDALLYNKDTVLYPFLKKLREKNLKVRLHTPNGLHVKFIDSESLAIMKEAGFETIRFGYESGHSRDRGATSDKISQKELSKKIALTLQSGFTGTQIGVYVMGGLPSQSPADMLQDLEFVHTLGVSVKPVFISPVPGTKLFEQYATQFPELRTDPLWHNDSFFITNLPSWDDSTIEMVRQKTRSLNSSLVNRQ